MTELNILHSNGKKVSIDQITYRLPFRFQSVIEYDNIYIFHCYLCYLDSASISFSMVCKSVTMGSA